MNTLNIIPGQLSLAQLRDVYQHPVKIIDRHDLTSNQWVSTLTDRSMGNETNCSSSYI